MTGLGCAQSVPAQAAVYYSSADVDTTPIGNVHFHGPFVNDTLTIRYDEIEPHDFLDISFDLLALRSLNGSWPMVKDRPSHQGPNFFRLGMENGATLFYTTFSNRPDDPGFYADARFQNYPSQIPGEHLKPQSGAAVANTLGYGFPWRGPSRFFPEDATYHIHFIIPDNSRRNALQLTGMNLATAVSQSWGVTDVVIKPLHKSEVIAPDDAAIAKAFDASLDPSTDELPGAFQTLISGMENTVQWLRKNVEPVSTVAVSASEVNQSIHNLSLDDSHVEERESAIANLIAAGPLIEPCVRDARAMAVGSVRQRLDWVLQSIGDTPIVDDKVRRVLLATRVLEIIRTPDALALRKEMSCRERAKASSATMSLR